MKQTKTLLLAILFSLTLKSDASNFFKNARKTNENAVFQKPLSGKRKGVIRFFLACGVVYLGGSTLRAHFGKSTKKRESIEMQPLGSSREQSPASPQEQEDESDNDSDVVTGLVTTGVQPNSTSKSLIFMSSEKSDAALPPVPKKRTPPIAISGSSSTLEKRASAHLDTALFLADTARNSSSKRNSLVLPEEREKERTSRVKTEYIQQKIAKLKQKKNVLKTFVRNKPNDDTTKQKKIEIAKTEKELKRLQAIIGKEKPSKNTGFQAGFLNRNSQPNKRLSSVLPPPKK